MVSISLIFAMASAGIVMRSSASAGLSGVITGFCGDGDHGGATLAARHVSVVLARGGADGDGQRHHGPMQRIGIGLVDLGGENVRAERPVACRDRHGHIEQRRKVLPHVELGILAADEHRNLAGPLRQVRLHGRRGIGDAGLVLLCVRRSGLRRRNCRHRRVGLLLGRCRVSLDRLGLWSDLRFGRRSFSLRCVGLRGLDVSAGFSSGVVLGVSAASVGFVSVLAASGCLAGSEASADLVSVLISVLAASSRTGALPVVTSDITVWPTEERSSSTPSALAVLVSTGFAS